MNVKTTPQLLMIRLSSIVLLLLPLLASAAADALKTSASSVLRAHAANPVDWMPWGDAAFDRAKREDRPIFLVVGVSNSELSAAMNRQTFSNPDVAAFLNETYVCVLVDRDEFPAVAAQGQAYVRAMKQLSGWPLNLWLTPELLPIEGATYLPPSEEWGKEGFLNVAKRVAAAWESDAAFAREDARHAIRMIEEFEAPLSLEPFRVGQVRTSLKGSAAAWLGQSDSDHGGFGESPRHPEPEMLRFLLRADPATRRGAADNLRGMLASALRDPIDGGFFRYTTDAAAHMPYFQKRLIDQARIILALLDAQQLAPDPQFDAAARAAINYVLDRLSTKSGLYSAGEDATGERTAFHVWTWDELRAAIGKEAADFATAHNAKPDGNVAPEDDPASTYLGVNILSGAPDPRWSKAIAKLREARDRRPAPVLDGNVIAADQGLLLLALARAGTELKETRYTEAARSLAEAMRGTLLQADTGELLRLAGSQAPAGPADYAAVALGLRALGNADARALADRVLRVADERFLDRESGVVFTTPTDLPRGIWLRLAAPASIPGDTIAAAPLRLLAGEPHVESVAAQLATQHRDPALPASGDLLLALRVHVDRLP